MYSLQFGMTGYLRKLFGSDGFRSELGTAIVGGGLIGPYASFCECTMIQQQRFGGSFFGTPTRIVKEFGLRGLFRGVSATIVRDALYVGGLLDWEWLGRGCCHGSVRCSVHCHERRPLPEN